MVQRTYSYTLETHNNVRTELICMGSKDCISFMKSFKIIDLIGFSVTNLWHILHQEPAAELFYESG